jgi:hypothetical protein
MNNKRLVMEHSERVREETNYVKNGHLKFLLPVFQEKNTEIGGIVIQQIKNAA